MDPARLLWYQISVEQLSKFRYSFMIHNNRVQISGFTNHLSI